MDLPEFLQNASVDEIHGKMLNSMPDDIDKSQGQHPYNYTRPTAMIVSEMCQQTLPQVIKQIWPMTAFGAWLDYHAEIRDASRRPATASTGELQLTVKAGTTVPEGSQFSTASTDSQPSIVFQTTEAAFSANGGTITVPVECTQTGPTGNVIAQTVIFKVSQLDGVTSVTNPEPITGGTDQEDDESLRARLVEIDQTRNISYVGSVADYRRWALEVPGVGGVTVIPASDDSGLVTVVITDGNGDPANETLCTAVYNHIMSPDDQYARLTAPNARLSVVGPTVIPLSITATVELEDGYVLDTVKAAFISAVQEYLGTARMDGEIRRSKICDLLGSIEGVYDYDNVTMNGGTGNVTITQTQLPQVTNDSVTLTEGAVA